MEAEMRRVIPCIGVCLFLTAAAESAFAQQRLFVAGYSEIVELGSRLPSLGAVIRRFPLPEDAVGADDVAQLGGGRFLIWTNGHEGIAVLDTQSGAVGRITSDDVRFWGTRVIGTDGNGRVVAVGLGGVVLAADLRLGRVRLNWDPLSYDMPILYASASDLLFIPRRNPTTFDPDFQTVDVIQASTGGVLKTLDLSPAPSGWLSVNAAGTRLFVNAPGSGMFAFDVASGTVTATNPSPPIFYAPILVDEQRSRFLATLGADTNTASIAAFSADSLSLLGSVRLPALPPPPPELRRGTGRGRYTDVSGVSATIFVLERLSTRFAGCWSQLVALDADTGHVRRTVDITDALGPIACESATLVRVTEPAPPTAGTADVAGHQVRLAWAAPFGATAYEVEAGSAPGLGDLARITVTEPQLVVDGVPSGVYYVRVRAINTIGKSGTSPEVQIIVR
jgi:hypothetical protein